MRTAPLSPTGLTSSEQAMSTGFHFASSATTVPLLSKHAVPDSYQSSRMSRPKSSPPSPVLPPATLRGAWISHNLRYRHNFRATETRDPVPSTSMAGLLKRFTILGQNAHGLVIVLVTLGLCAFVWVVLAAALTHHAIFVGEDPDILKDEDIDADVQLHLEGSSVSKPPSRLEASPGAVVVVHPWRTKAAHKLNGADGVAATKPPSDEPGRVLGVRGNDSSGHKPSGDVPIHPNLDAEDARHSEPARDFSEPVLISWNPTRARKSSRRPKRARHLYPRRHIHRESAGGSPDPGSAAQTITTNRSV
ncbi:uncharacterized protein LOC144097447 isoform X2 [Amblyomma americanum]